MRRRRAVAGALAAVGAAAILAGCGGSSPSTDTSGAPQLTVPTTGVATAPTQTTQSTTTTTATTTANTGATTGGTSPSGGNTATTGNTTSTTSTTGGAGL
jgi:hypothetical protein